MIMSFTKIILNKSHLSHIIWHGKVSRKIRMKMFPNNQLRSYGTSDKPNYFLEEVKVPVPGGILAGKLWTPKSPDSGKNSPVICLHGWLDNAGSFDPLLPLLMEKAPRTYLAFDLPGHGLTTYCSQWYYDGHVDGIIAVQRLLRHFRWERVSLLGHSMGSIIAFLFNGLYPELVDKYIGIEVMRPIPRSCHETMRAAIDLVFEVEEREKGSRRAYPFDKLLNRFYEGRQGAVGLEACQTLLIRGAKKSTEDGEKYSYSYNFHTLIPGQEGRFTPEMSVDLAKRISSSVCYIKADPGDVYETNEEYDRFFKVLETNLGSKLERHILPGSHHLHLNSPELVAPIISRFLRLSS